MAEVTRQIQEVSNIPEWAQKFAGQLFGMTFGDPFAPGTGGLLYTPYEQYTGQRVAGVNPLMGMGYQDISGMGVTPETRQAADIARQAAQRAGATSYTPYQAQNYYESPEFGRMGLGYLSAQAAPSTQYQMGPVERAAGYQYGPLSMGQAERVGASPLSTFQMGPAERVGAERVSAGELRGAQTGYRPDLQMFQMGPAERVGAERFGLGSMREYMSPYMQGVVEQQKRGAVQDYLRTIPQLGAQAIRAGAKGGSREAILESEARRGLAEQLGGIEATGLQQAYQQAASQFGQDRAAQMQAAMANQAAGLTTGQQNLAAALGVQQFGAQTGLQTALANLSNEQQARVQQEANRLQAQGMNQQAALQSALANQQAGLTTGQQNLAAQLGVQQLGAQTGLQAALANQQAGLTTGQQNLATEQARQQFMGQQMLQAALANQQMGFNVGQTNLQALINQAQFGAGQGLQAQQLNQQAALQAQQQGISQEQALNQLLAQNAAQRAQYGLAGQQLAEQSRQYGAGLGMQGIGQMLGAAGALSGFGQQAYQQGLGAAQARIGAGMQMRDIEQAQLSNLYQDFINRQQYPYKQLEFASGILRGFQPTGTTQTLYQPSGSTLGQIGGAMAGIGGLFGTLGGGGQQ